MPSHPLCNTAPAARWLGLALLLLSLGLLVMGVAVGSTGRLLNNPYFFTGMILLGNALFRCVPG